VWAWQGYGSCDRAFGKCRSPRAETLGPGGTASSARACADRGGSPTKQLPSSRRRRRKTWGALRRDR
jgi:hypothetical protein